RHVRRVAHETAHPAGFRMNVVRFRAPVGNQLVADRSWKRQIRKAVSVEVTQFAPSVTDFHSAKPMRARRHARPLLHAADDGLLNRFSHSDKSPATGAIVAPMCRPEDSLLRQ